MYLCRNRVIFWLFWVQHSTRAKCHWMMLALSSLKNKNNIEVKNYSTCSFFCFDFPCYLFIIIFLVVFFFVWRQIEHKIKFNEKYVLTFKKKRKKTSICVEFMTSGKMLLKFSFFSTRLLEEIWFFEPLSLHL